MLLKFGLPLEAPNNWKVLNNILSLSKEDIDEKIKRKSRKRINYIDSDSEPENEKLPNPNPSPERIEINDDDEWDDDIEIPSTQVEDNPVEKIPPSRSVQSPTSEELKVLKDNFGYSKFRPHQWEIISAVLSGRDQLVVMATGYGKSICFQFPALLTHGITLCVSPLISLMQDQVLRLKSLGIGAEYLGSAQTAKVRAKKSIKSGEVRVVYVTPEFCENQLEQLMEIHQARMSDFYP